MRALGRKFAGYFLTAGTAAIVDAGTFALLMRWGPPPAAAAVASFLLAAIVNYALSARLVFRHPLSAGGFAKFLSAAAVGFFINVIVTLVALRWLGLPPAWAKLVGIGTAFVPNFAFNALIVFPHRRVGSEAP